MTCGPLADRCQVLSELVRPEVAQQHAAFQEHPGEGAGVRVQRVAAPDPHRQNGQDPDVFLESQQPRRGWQASVKRGLEVLGEEGHCGVNRERQQEEGMLREVVDPVGGVRHGGEHAISGVGALERFLPGEEMSRVLSCYKYGAKNDLKKAEYR